MVDEADTTQANSAVLTPLNTALLLICLLPLIVGNIVGNGLVVFAVYRYHHLRTPTYLIIASLAMSDFLIGLIGIPLYLYFNLSTTTSCDSIAWIFFTAPIMILSGVSFVQIIAVSADRYIAITRPLRYATIVTTKRVQCVLACTCIIQSAFFLTRSYLLAAKDAKVITIKCPAGKHVADPNLWVMNLSLLMGIELSQLNGYHQSALAQVGIISVCINSVVNPVIYGYRDRLFREAFSDLRSRFVSFIS
ncbi:adenosine receptor A1-like [Diadema antillarum]|uniref:adenosine receptor A1-like n=1 Tax=Diadema antillarum TaxID=105358 RepID=UPI003A8500D6